MVLLLMGCEDLNTFCPKDNNDTNTSTDEIIIKPDDNTTNPDTNNTTPDDNTGKTTAYVLHRKIKMDLFWIGEPLDNNQTRDVSAWDNEWLMNYGDTDTPDDRDGYYPQDFTPDENPFYVALPYNDLDKNGKWKSDVVSTVPWATDKDDPSQSICKNSWVMITANRITVYAQWEDVGPSGDDDANYVFGGDDPVISKDANGSSISLSPAVRDYLNLDDSDLIRWKFVDQDDVPKGPWKDIVTVSSSN